MSRVLRRSQWFLDSLLTKFQFWNQWSSVETVFRSTWPKRSKSRCRKLLEDMCQGIIHTYESSSHQKHCHKAKPFRGGCQHHSRPIGVFFWCGGKSALKQKTFGYQELKRWECVALPNVLSLLSWIQGAWAVYVKEEEDDKSKHLFTRINRRTHE